MLKIWNRIKSFIQSNLLVISFIGIVVLSIIALLNRSSAESLALIQTITTIVALISITFSWIERRESLKKHNEKPEMRVTFIPGYITRTESELIPNNKLPNTENFSIQMRYTDLLKHWGMSGNTRPQATFIVRNIGNATLTAPVIRIVPQEIQTLPLTPHKGTDFEKETEGYVLYNPIGHIMIKDTVMYGFNCEIEKGSTHTYKISIRGANDDQVWTFLISLTVLDG